MLCSVMVGYQCLATLCSVRYCNTLTWILTTVKTSNLTTTFTVSETHYTIVWEYANALWISTGRTQSCILTRIKWGDYCCWIPVLETLNHMEYCVKNKQVILKNVVTHFFSMITAHKEWTFQYNPSTKHQNSQWKNPNSNTQKSKNNKKCWSATFYCQWTKLCRCMCTVLKHSELKWPKKQQTMTIHGHVSLWFWFVPHPP
jgi:hypothetical protein